MLLVIRACRAISFGINPGKGGQPPRDKRGGKIKAGIRGVKKEFRTVNVLDE